MDLFLILVIVSVNVINLVILVNIQIIRIVHVEKKLADPLIEECTEIINETKITNGNENKDKCPSYEVYKVLFWIFFILFIIGIVIVFTLFTVSV